PCPLAHHSGFLYGTWPAWVLGCAQLVQGAWDGRRGLVTLGVWEGTFAQLAPPMLVDLADAVEAGPPGLLLRLLQVRLDRRRRRRRRHAAGGHPAGERAATGHAVRVGAGRRRGERGAARRRRGRTLPRPDRRLLRGGRPRRRRLRAEEHLPQLE